ncbi:dihydrolipoamide acetyltransferase family protein [Bacillus tianshenii]|nr:dihydrolipoamide acetyltransferase family protein [Bacillus tianshenii]
MATQIIMPKLGMSMKEGTIIEWLKQENEEVLKNEPVAVISSDKIEKDIEAPEDGFLINIAAQTDEVVPVGKPIGYIGAQGEDIEPTVAAPANEESKQAAGEAVAVLDTPAPPKKSPAPPKGKARISPAARKLAKANNIEIESISGTGPKGRITRADVEKKINEQPEPTPSKEPVTQPASPQQATTAEAEIKPVSGMRKVIANRMFDSLQQSAQLTLTSKADVTDLMAIQKKLRENLQEGDVKLSITDFIARAVTLALQSHKNMNSAYIDGKIYEFKDVHLGIAVALENGLMVPVIGNAETCSIKQLAQQIRSLSKRARSGDLQPEEMNGSTFSITSLGHYGIEYFTPVLNPPEAGILGVGTIESTPVYRGDELERREILPLSLTFDHRVLDGAPASEFLAALKQLLENPYKMMID